MECTPATSATHVADSALKRPASSRVWIWAVLILVLVATAGIRFRLRDMPLERDEGEYAYAGQLLLQGVPPYELAYNMKFPGTYIAYAAIMKVFGQTAAGIHVGFLIVNAANTVMVFLLTARFTSRLGALAAAALYSYLALSVGVLGTSAHATHFVLLAALPGLLLLLSGIDRRSALSLFLSGFCLGAAVLMKQHGAVFVAFAAAYLACTCAWPMDWMRLCRQGTSLAAGVLTSLGLTLFWLWRAGVFPKFWFWTIQYGRAYAEERPSLMEIAKKLAHGTPEALYPVTYIALCGLGLLVFKKPRSAALFTAGLLVVSVAAIFPNFNFRPHYYVLMLPALCLLTGVAIASGSEMLQARGQSRTARTLVGLFVGGLLWAGYHEREVFFLRTPQAACRWAYGQSPFPKRFRSLPTSRPILLRMRGLPCSAPNPKSIFTPIAIPPQVTSTLML